jgi:hypothetical protein
LYLLAQNPGCHERGRLFFRQKLGPAFLLRLACRPAFQYLRGEPVLRRRDGWLY